MFEEGHRGKGLIGFLGSVIVAVLLGAVALFAVQHGAPLSSSSTIASTSSTQIDLTVPTSTIVIGASIPQTKSDQLFTLQLPGGTIESMKVASGWRVSALEIPNLSINQASGTIAFLRGTGWNVPLRFRGVPLAEARVVGLFDSLHAALLGRIDTDLALWSVTRVGEIRRVFILNEGVEVLMVREDRAWLATFAPGPGIESPPSGPSSLIEVNWDGTTSTIITEPRVITSVLPGLVVSSTRSIALSFDDGAMKVLTSAGIWEGSGKPLVWISPAKLLCAQGKKLFVLFMNDPDHALKDVVTLSEFPSVAFVSSTHP